MNINSYYNLKDICYNKKYILIKKLNNRKINIIFI